jgi:hypothetical protein
MKNNSIYCWGLVLLTTFTSCAKIYYSPDAKALASKEKIVAIIPPTVSIEASRKIDGESLKEQQRTESLNFQNEMYSWLLKRKSKGKITQEIQDIETTNAILKQHGYPEKLFTSNELCDILGVDGILKSNYSLSKPMSNGTAIALAVLGGFGGATNKVRVQLSMNDCLNKKLIWNYEHRYSGGIGSSPSSLIDDIMRHSSKKMPHYHK